ncbi:hypothetical protein [Pseudaquabacterium pictum]|uniref:Uncharacterized protein n=1 Tax=Pseudaquabacterium pictum TaxID=2315236 RepID=A0A480AN71_9BURK|nr:hypothetical protein [Rubrivivax pictus]GCL62941.1 hypothetical protein AQPW35_20220 [Rubrivivax pictus]
MNFAIEDCNLKVIRDFWGGRATLACGMTYRQLLETPPQEFLERPELLDWLLPVDFPASKTNGGPPSITAAQAATLWTDSEVSICCKTIFLHWMDINGFAHDSEGWVYTNRHAYGAAYELHRQLLDKPERIARALRMLVWSGLKGWESHEPDRAPTSFALGLYSWGINHWTPKHNKRTSPPPEWDAALETSLR